jgi:hypothetical protein
MKFNFRPATKWILVAAAVCIVFIMLAIPFRIPVTVTSRGKIIPCREWIISGNTDGRITSIVYDHLKGKTQSYFSSLFERGDAVQISFRNDFQVGARINEADTVGRIYSVNQERDFLQLQGFLDERRREMQLYRSGEKSAVRDEAEEQLAAARIQAGIQQSLAQRKYELLQKQLISAEEYEVERAKADLYNKNAAAAEATLRIVQSGAKAEQLDLVSSQISALEQEINLLRQRSQQSWLVAPVSGKVARYFSTDTLLLVQDQSQFLALIPIPWRDREVIRENLTVGIQPLESTETLEGFLVEIDDQVISINGRQAFMVVAAINDSTGKLASGLIVDARIKCQPVSLTGFILNFIQSIRIG